MITEVINFTVNKTIGTVFLEKYDRTECYNITCGIEPESKINDIKESMKNSEDDLILLVIKFVPLRRDYSDLLWDNIQRYTDKSAGYKVIKK